MKLILILWLPILMISSCNSVREATRTSSQAQYKGDVPPKKVSPGGPRYPAKAAKAGIEGDVRVKLEITDLGTVKQVVIIKRDFNVATFIDDDGTTKAVSELFDPPTIEFFMNSIWEPATVDGEPVTVWVEFPFHFKLHS